MASSGVLQPTQENWRGSHGNVEKSFGRVRMVESSSTVNQLIPILRKLEKIEHPVLDHLMKVATRKLTQSCRQEKRGIFRTPKTQPPQRFIAKPVPGLKGVYDLVAEVPTKEAQDSAGDSITKPGSEGNCSTSRPAFVPPGTYQIPARRDKEEKIIVNGKTVPKVDVTVASDVLRKVKGLGLRPWQRDQLIRRSAPAALGTPTSPLPVKEAEPVQSEATPSGMTSAISLDNMSYKGHPISVRHGEICSTYQWKKLPLYWTENGFCFKSGSGDLLPLEMYEGTGEGEVQRFRRDKRNQGMFPPVPQTQRRERTTNVVPAPKPIEAVVHAVHADWQACDKCQHGVCEQHRPKVRMRPRQVRRAEAARSGTLTRGGPGSVFFPSEDPTQRRC